MDLSEFLLARIDEDEERARSFEVDHAEALNGGFGQGGSERAPWIWLGAQTIGWTPARVLAECEAKRRIVEGFDWSQDGTGYDRVLRLLALPYAKHPDYQPQWAVDQVPA